MASGPDLGISPWYTIPINKLPEAIGNLDFRNQRDEELITAVLTDRVEDEEQRNGLISQLLQALARRPSRKKRLLNP